MRYKPQLTLLGGLAITLLTAVALSQSASAPPSAKEQQAEPTTPQAQPSAEEVQDDLMRRRANNQIIEPVRPADRTASGDDPRIAGTAPGSPKPKLKREGQFIITRAGRMSPANTQGLRWMYVFEADATGLADPPMYLMPCQLLEDMEGIVDQHGLATRFVISGQVFVYRGANYLLPTLIKLAPDRGNLKP